MYVNVAKAFAQCFKSITRIMTPPLYTRPLQLRLTVSNEHSTSKLSLFVFLFSVINSLKLQTSYLYVYMYTVYSGF